MEWSTASARGAGLSLQLRVRWVQGCTRYTLHTAIINKSTGSVSCTQGSKFEPCTVGACCVGGWVQPLADNTMLHLSELETGGVRHLGHFQCTISSSNTFFSFKVLFTSTLNKYFYELLSLLFT